MSLFSSLVNLTLATNLRRRSFSDCNRSLFLKCMRLVENLASNDQCGGMMRDIQNYYRRIQMGHNGLGAKTLQCLHTISNENHMRNRLHTRGTHRARIAFDWKVSVITPDQPAVTLVRYYRCQFLHRYRIRV